jgi:hypothetical protein
MQKISLSRSEAFRQLPVRTWEKIDDKLLASLKHDHMLEDESERDSRERLLESQYGATELNHVMRPRYMRDREGKNFRMVQKLDGIHIKRESGYSLYPMDPDPTEREGNTVGLLQSAITNSQAERNKYTSSDGKYRGGQTGRGRTQMNKQRYE